MLLSYQILLTSFLILSWIIPDTLSAQSSDDLYIVVLGVAQDGGYPQAGCKKDCCTLAWQDLSERKYVSSIAVVDRTSGQRFLFDCTPDFRDQLQLLDEIAPVKSAGIAIDGIFLTHAHIGHYTGLIHLGREALGTKSIPVYGTQRMVRFVRNNGPWSQLVQLKNIRTNELKVNHSIQLNERLKVTAFNVPHRDEFSDTVGFKISSATKSVVYLPDIDKWSRWDRSIEKLIDSVDIALLDGTFFENGELPGRDISVIPHPFIVESLAQFSALEANQRNRIKFIHLNHTNPAIRYSGDPKRNAAARRIVDAGMGLARQGEIIDLR